MKKNPFKKGLMLLAFCFITLLPLKSWAQYTCPFVITNSTASCTMQIAYEVLRNNCTSICAGVITLLPGASFTIATGSGCCPGSGGGGIDVYVDLTDVWDATNSVWDPVTMLPGSVHGNNVCHPPVLSAGGSPSGGTCQTSFSQVWNTWGVIIT